MKLHMVELAKSGAKLALSMALVGHFLTAAQAESATSNARPLSNSLAGNYLAARIAATDKDTQSAADYYRRAIALDPDNNSLKLKGFLSFIGNGDIEEGVELGQQISKTGNEPEIVSLVLSVEDIRKKNWPGAERRLTQNWRSAVDRLMAGLVMGWVKLGSDKVAEALETVDALKGPAWFDLFVQYHGGLIALSSGDTDEAIKRLDAAFNNRAGGQAATDTYLRIIAALAQAHFRANDVEKAKGVVEEALKRSPQNPIFERMKQNLAEGKGLSAGVSSPHVGAAEVFLNLGTAINREGGQEFARIYLQLAHTLTPQEDAVTSKLAELLDGQGMLLRANTLFESIKTDSPYYRIARLERALNLDELEDLEAARAELDSLVESGPDDLVTHLSYGAVLARHEDHLGAIDVYSKIIARIKKPSRIHWSLFYRQGIGYERTKQWPKAEAAFQKALELNPNQPSVLNYLGYSWVDMDMNLQAGLDMIRKAVDLRPNDGYMVDSLGWAYYKLGRMQEAVVELERAVELRPGDPTINDHLGDAYWKANRKLEATFQWQHALALDPPKADIARIEEKLEDGLDAVEKREAAAEKNPDKG